MKFVTHLQRRKLGIKKNTSFNFASLPLVWEPHYYFDIMQNLITYLLVTFNCIKSGSISPYLVRMQENLDQITPNTDTIYAV